MREHASKCGNQTHAERSSFRWGLSPSDGNRNQQAIATRSPSRRGLPPSDDDPMVARFEPPPRPSQSLWPCHPHSRNSSKSLHRPLLILYNATHGHRADSYLFTERHHSRAVPRGKVDRLVRFRSRNHTYSTPSHHRIDQRIARRFFDDNIDPHWSILLQPSILRYRDHHIHRCHRRTLRLHGLRSTDDLECLWHSAFTPNLNTQLSLLLHRSRMGCDAGAASLPSEVDESDCGEVSHQRSDRAFRWLGALRFILCSKLLQVRSNWKRHDCGANCGLYSCGSGGRRNRRWLCSSDSGWWSYWRWRWGLHLQVSLHRDRNMAPAAANKTMLLVLPFKSPTTAAKSKPWT
jgi:hypothetical protein